ncbi:MAG: hypothetical protein HY343_01790 [Lentisphaerae bacterium]|nr:hypothetical protein [Lentisphaerota bacterium]
MGHSVRRAAVSVLFLIGIVVPSVADLIVTSPDAMILGRVTGLDKQEYIITVEGGELRLGTDRVLHISSSTNVPDTYWSAARRLIQENKPVFAARCLEISAEIEPATAADARQLRQTLPVIPETTPATPSPPQSLSDERRQIAEWRAQGETLCKVGAAMQAGSSLSADGKIQKEKMARLQTKRGEALLAKAQTLEAEIQAREKARELARQQKQKKPEQSSFLVPPPESAATPAPKGAFNADNEMVKTRKVLTLAGIAALIGVILVWAWFKKD